MCAVATSEYVSAPLTTGEEQSSTISASPPINDTFTSFTESDEVTQSQEEGMATVGVTLTLFSDYTTSAGN